MVKLKRKQVPLIVLFLLIISIVIIVLSPIAEYNTHVQRGNASYFAKDKGTLGYDSYKILAYKDYKKAQDEWPILKFNYWFQKKFSESKSLVEDYKKNKPAVTAFLKKDFMESHVSEMVNSLKQMDYVTKVELISSNDALNIYKQRNKNDPQLLDLITADVLPASIEVFMSDWSKAEEVELFISKHAFVEKAVSSDHLQLN